MLLLKGIVTGRTSKAATIFVKDLDCELTLIGNSELPNLAESVAFHYDGSNKSLGTFVKLPPTLETRVIRGNVQVKVNILHDSQLVDNYDNIPIQAHKKLVYLFYSLYLHSCRDILAGCGISRGRILRNSNILPILSVFTRITVKVLIGCRCASSH